MRLAVISDIHGNLEAFYSVLEDIKDKGVTEIISLGDNIGYGPYPEEVLQEIKKQQIKSVLGNHEYGLIEPEKLDWFNPQAREALLITKNLLSAKAIAEFRDLPLSLSLYGARFVHGCPPDDANTYLFELDEEDLRQTFASFAEQICFVGHTHDLELISFEGELPKRTVLSEGILELSPQRRYIINVGSVGQPRDGDNHAKYVLWDVHKRRIEVCFVAYNIKKTVLAMQERGLPKRYADRLW
jgi:predicted phosphodiesterase